jgi:peptidoglycan/xylan/chitin deacetylase (PgdA/CDA1 family)
VPQARKNLDMTAAVIQQATGKRPTIFRPPYGIWTPQKNPKFNNTLANVARQDGYPVILWSMSSADTSRSILRDPAAIAKNVIHTPNPGGAFVLMHDGTGHMASVRALSLIIPQLQAKGYKFVTIPELLRAWAAWMDSQHAAPAAAPAAPVTAPTQEATGVAAPTPR